LESLPAFKASGSVGQAVRSAANSGSFSAQSAKQDARTLSKPSGLQSLRHELTATILRLPHNVVAAVGLLLPQQQSSPPGTRQAGKEPGPLSFADNGPGEAGEGSRTLNNQLGRLEL
jgi:hypothetical protein